MVFSKEASLQLGEEFLKTGEEKDEKRLLKGIFENFYVSKKQ